MTIHTATASPASQIIEDAAAAAPAALRVLDGVLDCVVGFALLGELVVIIADVVGRAVFDAPVLWANDIATLALTIIAFIGGAIAYRRDQHICVRTVVDAMPPPAQRVAYAFVDWMVIGTSLVACWFSAPVVESRWNMLTPVLEMRSTWLALPLTIGLLLLVLYAAQRLMVQRRGAVLGGFLIVAVLALIGVGLHLAYGGGFPANVAITLSILSVLVTVLLGIPIAFSLILGTIIYLYLATQGLMVALAQNMADGVGNFILLALPFFILAGLVMETGGLSRRLVVFIASVVGRLRGGLLHVTVVSMYIVSGISGSKSADVAAVGLVMRDMLDEEGYDRAEAAAALAASAAMGECVPPSIAMLVLGSITSVSMGALFVAGLIPAAVIALCLMVLIYVRAAHYNITPKKRPGFAGVAQLGLRAIIPFSMPAMLFAGILSGVATPTEVSSLAVAYGFLISFALYREMNLRGFARVVTETSGVAGMLLFTLAAAQAFSWTLSAAQLPQSLVVLVTGLHDNRVLFLCVSIVVLIVLGSLLEGLPALLILAPLFMPLAADMGISQLHYGIILIVAMGIGAFLPPLGVGFYISCVMARAPVARASRIMMSYIAVLVVGLLIVAFVPWFTLFLPQLFGFGE